MRWLIWILVLGALATGLTLLARLNTGYVLISLPGHRVELSLNFALVPNRQTPPPHPRIGIPHPVALSQSGSWCV